LVDRYRPGFPLMTAKNTITTARPKNGPKARSHSWAADRHDAVQSGGVDVVVLMLAGPPHLGSRWSSRSRFSNTPPPGST
jgi:hypothetical protein